MIKAAVELNDKDRKSIKEAVENAWQGEALAELQNYVRIPCKSKDFDVDWEVNGFLRQACRKAAEWGQSLFPEAVFEVLTEPGRRRGACSFLLWPF